MRKVKYDTGLCKLLDETKSLDEFSCEKIYEEGIFHQFTSDGYNAVIETSEGKIETIHVSNIKFLDKPEDEKWEQRRYEIARDLWTMDNYAKIGSSIIESDKLIKALKGEQSEDI